MKPIEGPKAICPRCNTEVIWLFEIEEFQLGPTRLGACNCFKTVHQDGWDYKVGSHTIKMIERRMYKDKGFSKPFIIIETQVYEANRDSPVR